MNHLITIGTSTTNLSANTITTSGNLGVTGTSTLYGQVYAQGGITGATASFSYISTTQAISGQTGTFTNLTVTQNEVIQGTLGVTGTSALYGNVGIGKGPTGTYALDVSGNVNISSNLNVGGVVNSGNYILEINNGYIRVGTFTVPNRVGQGIHFKFYSHAYYNANNNEDYVFELYFKVADMELDYTFPANSFYYRYGESTVNPSPVWYVTDSDSQNQLTFDLYIYTYPDNNNSFYEVYYTDGCTWTDSPALGLPTSSYPSLNATEEYILQTPTTFNGNVGIGKGPTGTYALDVLGSANISNNLNVGGVVNSGNYQLLSLGNYSSQYIRVGTFTVPPPPPQNGQGIHFKFYTHVGFNANNNEDCVFELFFKLSNGTSANGSGVKANSFYYRYGGNTFNPSPIWYVTDYPTQLTFDLYIYAATFNNTSFYEVYYTDGCSWTNSPASGLPSGYPSLNATEEYILQTPTTFNGNVGIGIGPSSSYALDVSGSIYIGPSASANGIIFQDGTKQTSAYTSSDYRIKQNIVPLNNTYSTDNLNPVTYHNIQLGKQDIGLIAHELQEVYPMLVNGEKDGECMQTINYVGLIPIIIKEIQDLKKKVQVLMEDKNK